MFPLYAGIPAAYLIGSIPTALIAGRLLAGVDIRTVGSKNAGATNLYRVCGLKPYIGVLAFDILKGYTATKGISSLVETDLVSPLHLMLICGFCAVLGHIFTVFARFRGGKGVAAAAGMMLALIPAPLLIALAVYVAVTSVTHYVSLGSIGAALSLPLICIIARLAWGVVYPPEIYAIILLLVAVIIITHRGNITRLLQGTENKTYFLGGNGRKEADG